MMTSALPLLVGVPLLAGIASVVISSHRWRAGISTVFAVVQVLIVSLLVLHMQAVDAPYRYAFHYTLGGWGAPLGIDLAIDGLSLILLSVTAFLVLILSTYSTCYFSDPAKAERFWPLWWLLVAGLNAAFIAADAFNLYVALEMIGLSAVSLVAIAGTRKALSAALQYALVGLSGSLCYLLGVALLYRAYGTLDLAQLAALAQAEPMTWAALCLISIGLLMKTALLPLHFWLPQAHASAPGPVSAVLSALVVKASFYLLIRFWLDVLAPAVTEVAVNFLGILGATAIFWGCISAYRAQRLKLLVAYSTVAQLGYLFLLFPLALASSPSPLIGNAAVVAIIYFIIAHALAKAAMFLAVSNILVSFGHDEIDKLQGLAHLQPLTLVTFTLAGISLVGLPLSGGFIAKWLLLNVAIDNGQWWWVAIMLGGSLLTATYIVRILNIAFNQTDLPSATSVRQLPKTMTVCGLVLAISAILLGFGAESIMDLIGGDPSATAGEAL